MKTFESDPQFSVDAVPPEAVGGEAMRLPAQERPRRPIGMVFAVIALIAAALVFYFFWFRDGSSPPPVVATRPAVVAAPPTAPEPAIHDPVEKIPGLAGLDSAPAPRPLPKLDESDVVASDAIKTTLNGDAGIRLLVPEAIIRHIVATVDSLPRKTIAPRILPVTAVPGALTTATAADGLAIAPDNAGRYAVYVKTAEAIDAKRLAGFYVRLYPLFQQAYVELGYPDGYFNDRLIAVIDHLLAAPEPKPPIYVAQPKVLFEFADPDLEALSAGQKILVRMGLDNELRVKGKLREIRKKLSARPAIP
jgi:Protein of unknown function (DUF3014)